ncbi:uncharacterized protein [Physcomitrium patens]|uniref:C2H2-type domain-containing protein n=2 Tax=Physcomitrium patens TaxID=3218 RepID=A0A2K1IUW2_PHYPA|nr:uncharacterized protein LOC112272956 isoform X1 [Physcomitrium patens]PNR33064.1 hypothetical protein PHYPA_025007 [Physcomitrium patens]|eukprot:XP_024356943.1 uncharacterized protein LOC112272956 isoform X1 [Physcomitrella patens]
MPSKPSFPQPSPLLLPLSAPTMDSHSDDVQTPTPDNSGSKRKRRSVDEGSTTDEEGDVSKTLYECRFCNMRFAKSQALGGHMNRHRQEREKEQYQHAQQLVSSMAQQQQMPRTWTSMAAELNPLSAGVALARLSTQLTANPRPDGSRSQIPPQISFNSTPPPINMSSSSSIPSSMSSSYFFPSSSSSNNLHHLQWNVDEFNTTIPRSGSQEGLNVMDFSLQGTSLRDDFLSDVLQSRQDGGSFMGSQFSNMPPLMSRGLSSVETGSFYSGGEESVQEKSGTAGLQFDNNHSSLQQSSIRMNGMLQHSTCSSSPLHSSLMNSDIHHDAKSLANSFARVRTSAPGHTFLMQCNDTVEFN